jgi:Ca2+-binding RTX toxin-like protein
MTVCIIESVEPRRLFAIDLTGSISLAQPAPYYTDFNPSAQLNITMRNIGGSDATIFPVVGIAYMSKDKVLDTSNDIECGTVTAPQGIGHGKKQSFQTDLNFTLPPTGNYYLCIFVDAPQAYKGEHNPYADMNRDNNIVFTDTPVVTVVPTLTPNITGTAGKDVLKVTQNSSHVIVTMNGAVSAAPISSVPVINAQLGASADKLLADSSVTIKLAVSGGGGNDTLIGGEAGDELSGAGGKDKVYGQGGADYLIGGGSNDYLEGGAGNDTLSAGAGNDKLVGLAGKDYMIGGLGDDQFFARDAEKDTLSGNAGDDSADYDGIDFKTSIESLIA